MNPALAKLPQQTARLAELKRTAKLDEDVYKALQQKYNDATVSRATGISDVTVTAPASADARGQDAASDDQPARRRAGRACCSRLGIVFLIEWFDGRIRDERDVETDLQLPVLASVPMLPSGDGAAAIPVNVRNAALESYFQLVLAMRYSTDRPLRTVTITSPLKGDGKSTVAMNVAGAFGEIAVSSIEREARVLVIDADMRRPSLHRKFEVPNEIGLSDILVGRASFAQAVQRTDRPGRRRPHQRHALAQPDQAAAVEPLRRAAARGARTLRHRDRRRARRSSRCSTRRSSRRRPTARC